ncbi:hypothetical protein D8T45_21150 [Vibrio vulnificus]|nr:hypothetical protein D8T45_21150 [Vibrio vulnificus]RZR20655.1 hypothetical protein D8T24_00680 [Vibrio vulnificus]
MLPTLFLLYFRIKFLEIDSVRALSCTRQSRKSTINIFGMMLQTIMEVLYVMRLGTKSKVLIGFVS